MAWLIYLFFELHILIPALLYKYRNDEVIFARRCFPDERHHHARKKSKYVSLIQVMARAQCDNFGEKVSFV